MDCSLAVFGPTIGFSSLLTTSQKKNSMFFRSFLREVYDGQLFIKLKKGSDFPAMDPWVSFLCLTTSHKLLFS